MNLIKFKKTFLFFRKYNDYIIILLKGIYLILKNFKNKKNLFYNFTIFLNLNIILMIKTKIIICKRLLISIFILISPTFQKLYYFQDLEFQLLIDYFLPYYL